MSASDFDIHKLNDLRRRILAGEEYTDEELAEAIAFRRHILREERRAAETPKTRRKKETLPNFDDLLNG